MTKPAIIKETKTLSTATLHQRPPPKPVDTPSIDEGPYIAIRSATTTASRWFFIYNFHSMVNLMQTF